MKSDTFVSLSISWFVASFVIIFGLLGQAISNYRDAKMWHRELQVYRQDFYDLQQTKAKTITNTVVIFTNQVATLDLFMAEQFYKKGVTNGAIAHGNELVVLFDWNQGTGTLRKTVQELIEIQHRAMEAGALSWKGRNK